MEAKKVGPPFKYTVDQLKELYKEYRIERNKQFDIAYELIKSGDMAGNVVEIKKPKIPTILSFCHYIGITEKTFFNWINGESKHIDDKLFQFITYIQEELKDERLSRALNGTIDARLTARLDGYKEIQQHEVTAPDKITIDLNNSNIDLSK